MYLGNLGATIDVRLPNGQIQSFGSITAELDAALSSGVAVNGYAERFAGGWLMNGCPLNVWFGGAWLPGQKDALRAAGKTTCPGVIEPMATAAAPPSGGSSPTFVTTAAPVYSGGGFTASGRQILPTGVQTPSAPIIVQSPAGPVMDFGMTPPPAAPGPQQAGMDTSTMLILGIALLSVLRRR